MSLKQIARELRRHQTDEEKELWRALRGRRFAGFKFRRQHMVGDHILDFYCADAKLAVELDGSQHGQPEGIQRDAAREKFLTEQGIKTLRFWNHQWHKNREGCLLEIWNLVQQRSGCVCIVKNAEEQRFVPPNWKRLKLSENQHPSPQPSPRLAGRGRTSGGTNYAKAINFLYDLRLFGTKFGLENTFKLAALAGNPQNHLRFIHVAGTNGKGSTCAMLESIYRAAGLRVGLFTSPHLVSFRERIQVNRQPISESDVVRLVTEFQLLLKQFPADHHPTFFEVVTVMALRYFEEQKCDLVIWETGLGGRLDATNIVTPLASVITNIGYDHQQWLGDTLEKIAAEKAGIIKPGVPVLTATDEPAALAVIENAARKQDAALTHVGAKPVFSIQYPVLLFGEHQKINAALAVATVEVLQTRIPISAEAIRRGLETVHWPGRLQRVMRPNGQQFLLDGAHNIASVKTLAATLKQKFPGGKPTLILGVLRDKDWRQMCATIAPAASRVLTVPIATERTANADELADACRQICPKTEVVVCSSLSDALEKTAGDPFVLIAGSLYLIGEAMELLGLMEIPESDEKKLNDWKVSMNRK